MAHFEMFVENGEKQFVLMCDAVDEEHSSSSLRISDAHRQRYGLTGYVAMKTTMQLNKRLKRSSSVFSNNLLMSAYCPVCDKALNFRILVDKTVMLVE